MCGIVGVYHFEQGRPVAPEILRAMADSIVHRGPDDHGYFTRDAAGFGMRRLSIIDLAGGHQPIASEDGRAVIVFNGEVYNFREERAALEARGRRFTTHSDTEVVLQLYEEHGEEFLARLNGMFGLAIWDEARRGLLVARDRIGIKPLYYYRDDERVVFASEVKAILTHPDVQAELDPSGLAAYLRHGFTPAPFTLFRNVHKVPPAHYLWIDGNGMREREYWRPSYADKHHGSVHEVATGVHDLLESAVHMQLVSDVPLGAFLSGGMDSSSIVHLMQGHGDGTTRTYSIGFGAEHAFHSELPLARRFADEYGADHHEIVVEPDVADLMPRLVGHLDEPVADSSFLVTYLVAQLARESVKVILSGVGGDELFGGYRRYLNARLFRYLSWLPQSVRGGIIAPLARRLPADRNSTVMNLLRLGKGFLGNVDRPPTAQYREFTTIFAPDVIREVSAHAGTVDDVHQRYFDECDSSDPLDQIMYFDLKTSLPEQLLMLTDKMTMAVSLEGRVPYLDHRLVEYAARIPSSMRIKGLELRHIQRAALRGRLPDHVFEQRKRGFGAPVGAWVRGDLREMVGDLLGRDRLANQGLFDPGAVERVLDDHYRMREDHTDHILALLGFQLWADEYLGPARTA